MANLTKGKECPSCGATREIETRHEERNVEVALGPTMQYQATIDHCNKCGFTGDFLEENELKIAKALIEGKRAAMKSIIDELAETNKFSMAYMERALELPIRTMMRWKRGKFTDAALALMRIVGTFPWAVRVADEKFNSTVASKHLLEESLKAVFRNSNIQLPEIAPRAQTLTSSGNCVKTDVDNVPVAGATRPTLVQV